MRFVTTRGVRPLAAVGAGAPGPHHAEAVEAASGGVSLRQAMLDWYVPRQGPEFETWLDALDAVAARIEPEKIFTFSTGS